MKMRENDQYSKRESEYMSLRSLPLTHVECTYIPLRREGVVTDKFISGLDF